MSREGVRTTYFGLWSQAKIDRARKLLSDLGIGFEITEYRTTQDILEDWEAWDPNAGDPYLGMDLWIWTDDLPRLGTKLVEMFPERKFGG